MLSNLILSFPIVMLESHMSDSESCASSTSSSMMISSSSEESSANVSPGSISSCSSTSSNCSFSSTTSVSGKNTKDQGSPYPPEIHREMVERPNVQWICSFGLLGNTKFNFRNSLYFRLQYFAPHCVMYVRKYLRLIYEQ